ncbi:MAG: hypothetical protein P1V20_27395 [Verrucomicrobiales bacterium]|nr:hypothetical protein [Verrucomicrobiales bacterium]
MTPIREKLKDWLFGPDENNNRGRIKKDDSFDEASRMLMDTFRSWNVGNVLDENGHPENYHFSQTFLREFDNPPSSDLRLVDVRKQYAQAVAAHIVTLPKTIQILRMLLRDGAVYEILIALQPQTLKIFRKWYDDFDANFCQEFGMVISSAIVKEMVAKAVSILSEDDDEYIVEKLSRTVDDDIAKRLFVQCQVLKDVGGGLCEDEFYYISKIRQREHGHSSNFLIKDTSAMNEEHEGYLWTEQHTPITRMKNDSGDFSRQISTVSRMSFPENYRFHVGNYPSEKLLLRMIDIYPSTVGKGQRLYIYYHETLPQNSVSPKKLMSYISEATEGKIQCQYFQEDANDILQWRSTQGRGQKGQVELIAFRRPGEPNWMVLDTPVRDRLNVASVNFCPQFQQEDGAGTSGVILANPLAQIGLAISTNPAMREMWVNMSPAELHGIRTGIFNIIFAPSRDQGEQFMYHLFQGTLADGVQFHLAPFSSVADKHGKKTEQILDTTMDEAFRVQPTPHAEAIEKSGGGAHHPSNVEIRDMNYFLIVGSEETGYFAFSIQAGSRARYGYSPQSVATHGDISQSHTMINSFCRTLGIQDLKNAPVQVRQGDLLIGSDKKDDSRIYVRVYYGDDLSERKEALRRAWNVISNPAHNLLPDTTKRHLLSGSYKPLRSTEEAKSACWVLTSREHQTLQSILEKRGPDLSIDDTNRLVESITDFYGRALRAGLSFSDCSVDDILVSPDYGTMWLADYGSYQDLAEWQPSENPGKDDYRDPGLMYYLHHGKTEFTIEEKYQLHAYNLGLLRFRIWGRGAVPKWPSLADEFYQSPDRYFQFVCDQTMALYDLIGEWTENAVYRTNVKQRLDEAFLFNINDRPYSFVALTH